MTQLHVFNWKCLHHVGTYLYKDGDGDEDHLCTIARQCHSQLTALSRGEQPVHTVRLDEQRRKDGGDADVESEEGDVA